MKDLSSENRKLFITFNSRIRVTRGDEGIMGFITCSWDVYQSTCNYRNFKLVIIKLS